MTDLKEISEEKRFQLLVNAVVDYAIYMLDAEGCVATWNPGAERFKGYTHDEIIGEHFSRFFTDEDRAADLPARALRIAAREGRFEAEGWRVRKDGSQFWAHAVLDPIHAPDGSLLGFAKITRDVTAKREQEKALYDSEQRFRILIQGVRDYAIYMLDPKGRVTNWNSGAQAHQGLHRERNCRGAFLPLLHRAGSCRGRARAGAGNRASRGQIRARSLAGAEGRFAVLGQRGD